MSQALRTPAELRSGEGQTPPLPQAMRAAFHLQPKRCRKGASTAIKSSGSRRCLECTSVNKSSLSSLRLKFKQ